MDEVDTTYRFRLFDFDFARRGRRPDYRKRLWDEQAAEDATSGRLSCPAAERIRAVAQDVQHNTVAFQSVAVAALQTLGCVLQRERQVAAASISLAQNEKLHAMINALEATTEALRDLLSAQGSKMLRMCSGPAAPERLHENSWWFALVEAIQVLEEGMERMISIASGQPKGSAARLLSSVVVRQLRSQHHLLLAEADQWIS